MLEKWFQVSTKRKHHKTAQPTYAACCVLSFFVLHIVSFYPSCILMYVHDKEEEEELFCVYFEEHKRCFFIFLKKDDFFLGREAIGKVDDEKNCRIVSCSRKVSFFCCCSKWTQADLRNDI